MATTGQRAATLKELVGRQQPGYTLEQPFYVDPAIFAADIEQVYRRHWLLAGPTCRLREAGDYFTYQVAADSLVILRDEAGKVRAFHNVCRHRGSRICLEEQGRATRLVCPYHAWTYGLDGSLLSARHLPDGLDTRTFGLDPVAVRVVEGLIFVCLAAAPPDFSQTAEDVARYLRPHDLARTKICRRTVDIVRANWKLVAENFWECYHCAPAHPEFCSVMSYAHAQNNPRLAEERREFERAWEAETRLKGRLVGSVPPSDRGLHQGGRIPIRPGFATQSQDGRPLAPLLGDYTEYDGGVTSFMHLPLVWYVVNNDHAFLTRFTPVSPLETEVELIWLVHEDAVEGRDYDPDAVSWVWRITVEQDRTICENNQLGVLSSRYRPGPHAATERPADDFVRWYLGELAAFAGAGS